MFRPSDTSCDQKSAVSDETEPCAQAFKGLYDQDDILRPEEQTLYSYCLEVQLHCNVLYISTGFIPHYKHYRMVRNERQIRYVPSLKFASVVYVMSS